jgi:transcriptional accessory protein Tex/SPT6
MNILQQIEAEQVARLSSGKRIDNFKPGDVVKVKVVEVDIARKRIALTMRLADEVQRKTGAAAPKVGAGEPTKQQGGRTNDALLAVANGGTVLACTALCTPLTT